VGPSLIFICLDLLIYQHAVDFLINISDNVLLQGYKCMGHEHTLSQPENYELVAGWRYLVETHNRSHPRQRLAHRSIDPFHLLMTLRLIEMTRILLSSFFLIS